MLPLAPILGFKTHVTNSIYLYEWKVVISKQLLRVVNRLHPNETYSVIE